MSETTTVEEPQANPYNAKKSYDGERAKPRGLLNSNEALYQPDPALNTSDGTSQETSAATQGDELPEDAANKYNKVDYKKRYDDMKRHYDHKLVEWREKEKVLETKLSTVTQEHKIPKTPEELATFKKEYPDVYDVVESVAFKQSQDQLEKVKEEIEVLRAQANEASMREAQLVLEKLQPDYHEIVASDDFHTWAEVQPSEIKSWVYDNATNADLASRAIDLYKKDKGMFSDPQSMNVQTAPVPDAAEAVMIKDVATPTTGEKKIWTNSEIARLSIEQFQEMESELQEAAREGRIAKG